MKIVHFHFGKDGGAERFFVHLVNAFAGRGVEQKIVIRPDRAWKADLDASVDVEESHFRTASLDRILLPLRVRAMIRQWRPDCVLGWMPKGAKLVPGVAGPLKLVRLGDYPTSLRKFRNIDTVVCNTPGIARHVREMGWTRGIEVISNFTETVAAVPVARSVLDTPEDAYVVSSMGRFVPRKGFDVLIRALAGRPDIVLWLIGGGEEEQNLKALAAELGVADRVRFAGWHKDPLPFIAASDCFAMASSHEPLGNVVLEAWGQGFRWSRRAPRVRPGSCATKRTGFWSTSATTRPLPRRSNACGRSRNSYRASSRAAARRWTPCSRKMPSSAPI